MTELKLKNEYLHLFDPYQYLIPTNQSEAEEKIKLIAKRSTLNEFLGNPD